MFRLASRTSQTLIDLAVLSLAFWMAFLLRFEFEMPPVMFKRLVFLWPYIVLFEYLVLAITGVTRYAWRYIGLRESIRIFSALALASGVLLAVRLAAPPVAEHLPWARLAMVPIGVIVINFMMGFMGSAGIRFMRRLMGERREALGRRDQGKLAKPTLLIGAGQAGVMVAREISNRPDLGIKPVGFVDDDPLKVGTVVHGLQVMGKVEEIESIATRSGAEQVLITIANAPGSEIRKIVKTCEGSGLPTKIIPGIFEIINGKVNLTRIRNVSVEDLLGRAAVELDQELVSRFVTGKRVLVSGAGGSIGSELCRQVAAFGPATLLLLERSEFHLYSIHKELSNEYPELKLIPLLCDVTAEKLVHSLFDEHQPQIVFHAAAHKHVPMVELNPGEAIHNNVFGTKFVSEAASAVDAEAFVMISTDKAVNPTSIMGATKRVAEMWVQAMGQKSKTRFVAVRFGNVLGSTGSVIPLFREQIARGGPVTVTHPEMMRYFMTIPEASQLVMQAGAMGEGGEIFVLDMGEPVRILDLAEDLIKLSGFEPRIDIPIRFSGPRPGEKLFEELGFDAEKMNKTRHPKIFTGKLSPHPIEEIEASLQALSHLRLSTNRKTVRAALSHAVPEMIPDALERPSAEQSQKQAQDSAALLTTSPSQT